MKYLVGIPFINRPDLLENALNSIQTYRENTVVIDNSEKLTLRDHPHISSQVQIYEPPAPLSHTESMNLFQEMSKERDCKVVMYMHTDAEAKEKTPEKLLDLINGMEANKRRWGVIFTNIDALAAYSMEAINEVGPWDTYFPNYWGDIDWYYRIKLCEFEFIESGLPVYHHCSSSIKEDPNLHKEVFDQYAIWESYYIRKWGGTRDKEKYIIPFNGKN